MASEVSKPTETADTSAICAKLAVVLVGKVHLPNTTTYQASVGSYFFRTARQSPACIITPTSAEDVSAVVRILGTFPDVKFAIRSGGHTPNANFSNVESGITIDLRSLNTIQTSDGRDDVLEVGTGAEWGEVYDYLEKSGRSAVGSREPSVGVGGFITGGGLSFFSPELGFACDRVLNFQVVLASGEIVNANASDNVDLFRALRGGQSNFGIVTRFDLITHAQERYWGGGILYPDMTEDAQLQAFVDLKSGEYDPYAAIVQSFLYFGSQKSFVVSNNMAYLRPIEHPQGLKALEDIQPQIQGTMRMDTTKSFALELQRWQPINQNALYVTTTIKLTPTIGKKINNIWRAATVEISDISNITSVLTYQQLPPQDKDNPNGMGLDPDAELHKELLVLIMSIYWPTDEDSERITKVARDAMDKIEVVAEEEHSLFPWKYMNYAAAWQNPPKSFGADALSALNRVSHKYDPDGLFQRQAVGFKL